MSDPQDSPQVSYIVCGAGRTGSTIALMLARRGFRTAVLDCSAERLEKLDENESLPTMQGDCLEDDVLSSSGVAAARGLFATLPQDRDNVFLVLSAKRLSPTIRVVSRCVDPETTRKLRLVGADRIVTQSEVEGLRLSSQLVRPDVVRFLDILLYSTEEEGIRYRRIAVPDSSPAEGSSIGELQLGRRTGVVIAALRKASGRMIYSPRARLRVDAGDQLIAFATTADAQAMEKALAEGPVEQRRRWWRRRGR
ncbi:NAD-binding protein [Candidatus Fermentibacterales bacterium]|nr:NAD-binding protein [Candidatus Fermentibacterales bacterium]